MFFYVKNANPTVDRINLPPFVDMPPVEKQNWGHDPKSLSGKIMNICPRIPEMMDREGLVSTDLITTFLAR